MSVSEAKLRRCCGEDVVPVDLAKAEGSCEIINIRGVNR